MHLSTVDRFLAAVSSLTIALALAAQGPGLPTALADSGGLETSGSCGSGVTWDLDLSTGALTISGSGSMSGKPWEPLRNRIKSVHIEPGVTSISVYAFDSCSFLSSVDIPSSVEKIGYSAFDGCTSLSSVSIPGPVDAIGSYTFNDCVSLTSASLPSTLITIDGSAFSGCSSLTAIDIPDGVDSIGRYSFSGCTSLRSVGMPSSLLSIGYGAFYGCSSLLSVEIPPNVVSVGEIAFRGCTSLPYVSIPPSLTSIGKNAFDGAAYVVVATREQYERLAPSWGSEHWNTLLFAGDTAITDVRLSSDALTYCGQVVRPALRVFVGQRELGSSYYRTSWSGDCTSVGQHGVTVTGVAPFTGSVSATFSITPKPLPASGFSLSQAAFTWTGSAFTPQVIGPAGLEEGRDYSVSFSDNVSPGEGSATIAGMGEYGGAITLRFTIEKAEQSATRISTSTARAKGLAAGKLKATRSFSLRASGIAEKARLSWAKANNAGGSRIKVSKAGKLSVAKGTKKGTYKVRVRLSVAPTQNYKGKALAKTVIVTVR